MRIENADQAKDKSEGPGEETSEKPTEEKAQDVGQAARDNKHNKQEGVIEGLDDKKLALNE